MQQQRRQRNDTVLSISVTMRLRRQAAPRTVTNTKAIAARVMAAAASQPNVLLNRPLVCSPITLRSEPNKVIRITSGGATSP
jgi:hypothetical protein